MKRTFLFSCLMTLCLLAQAQTDMTSRIVNPGFEEKLTGWINDGMAAQSNNAFALKVGTYYCEKWTGKGGKVGNGSITQMVTGLPAGEYTVRAVAQNIQEDTPSTVQTGVYIVANSDKGKVNVAGTYSVKTIIIDGTINLGLLIQGATGNYVTVDDFHLTNEVSTSETYTTMHQLMQALIDEANSIDKHLQTQEQTELDAARSAVASLMTTDTTDGVTEAVCRLQEAIYQYRLSIASPTDPIDMTSALANPNFEINGSEGWVNQGMAAQSNASFELKNGSTYMEKWVGASSKVGDATLSQIVELPSGNYVLTAAAQNINQNNKSVVQPGAYIFAGNKKVNVNKADTYRLEFTVIEGYITLGFMTRSAGGNWVCVDNFHLQYQGRSEVGLLSELQARTDYARTLLDKRMNVTTLAALAVAIEAAEALRSTEGMEAIAATLNICTENAELSIDAYERLAQAIADKKAELNGGKGAEEFQQAIDNAQADYDNDYMTVEDIEASIQTLETALFAYKIANASGSVPTVKTMTFVARGATGALGRSTITGSNIMEKGFCWATHPNPTVLDNRSTSSYDINGPMYLMQPLEPATVYYVRAYAITNNYAVGYGEVRKVITLPMGTCSWWYNNGGSPAENERINEALADCIYYYNNWSGIRDFRISCSYGAGTPTADCSYGGSMRVGPNASYQRTGTILHESNHGVGVGTSSRWWDTNLHNGDWFGERANKMLQFIDNNPDAKMHGDNTHMWPYGINGASEDSGWPMLYIANVLITQAMHEDGLCPPGHGASPVYSFESEDTVKYYLTSESDKFGSSTGYLTETSSGTLTWKTADAAELAENDAFAWYLTFNPQTGLYRIRNAQSGKYFSYSGSTIKTASKDAPGATENFMLMASRTTKSFGDKPSSPKGKGYWMLQGTDEFEPYALTAGASGATSSSRFNISDAATQQRWVILTFAEAQKLTGGLVTDAKNKLQRYIDCANQMTEVQSIETTEGVTEALSTLADDYAAAIGTMTVLTDIETAISQLSTAIIAFLEGATPADLAQPFDVSCFIEEPQLATLDPWTCEPTPALAYGVASFGGVKFAMTQTLPKMPKGAYGLKAQAFERPGLIDDVYAEWLAGTNSAKSYIYLKSATNKGVFSHICSDASAESLGGSEAKVGEQYVPANAEAASIYFADGRYEVFAAARHGSKSDLELGAKELSAIEDSWSAITNFRLFFYGKDTSKDDVVSIESPVATDCTPASAVIYDLSGRPIQAGRLTHGIYIIKEGNSVRKFTK